MKTGHISKKSRLTAPASALALLTVQPLPASDNFSEEDYYGDIPVVINATRMAQRLNQTPAAITIIDRETIDMAGVIEVADLFRLVPGFQSHYVNGSFWGVQSHGMGNKYTRRLEIKVNGRSIYLPNLSTVDWATLGVELEDIDRIEVVRGSNVPTDGSNALLGSINIVCKSPLLEQGTQVRTLLGSSGKQKHYLRHNSHTKSLDYRIGVSHSDDPGFRDINDRGRISGINLQATYTPGLLDELSLFAGYNYGDTLLGDGDHPDDFLDRGVDSAYIHGKWRHDPHADDSFEVNLYYNFLNQDDHVSFLEDGLLLTEGVLDATSERFDLDFQRQFRLNERLRGVWATGVRLDRLQSDYVLRPGLGTMENWTLRLQGNLEWSPATDWTVNAGLMLERGSYDDELLPSPRLAVNYSIDPNQSLRLVATQAFRQPSILEQRMYKGLRLPDGTLWDYLEISFGDLKAERIDMVDIGYSARFPEQRLELDLRGFYEEVTDGVGRVIRQDISEPDGSDRVNAFENSSTWRTTGLEATLKYRPISHALIALQYGQANIVGKRQRKPWKDNGGFESLFERTPEHTLSLLTNYQFSEGFHGSLVWYYTSYVKWLDGTEVDPIQRVDLQLKKQFKLNDLEGDVAFIVHNLFDKYYLEFQENQYYDRRAFLKLRLAF